MGSLITRVLYMEFLFCPRRGKHTGPTRLQKTNMTMDKTTNFNLKMYLPYKDVSFQK